MVLLIAIITLGLLSSIGLGIFFKFFTPDDFSIWNNSWFGKDEKKNQDYIDR